MQSRRPMDKVLIVEDDRIHLKRLTTVLEKHRDKFEVIPAVDGQEAIDILKQGPVSLMVTDIQMPRVDVSPEPSLLCHDRVWNPADESPPSQRSHPVFQ